MVVIVGCVRQLVEYRDPAVASHAPFDEAASALVCEETHTDTETETG